MESGPSQMECNSVHSAFEKVKNNVLIYAPMCITEYLIVLFKRIHIAYIRCWPVSCLALENCQADNKNKIKRCRQMHSQLTEDEMDRCDNDQPEKIMLKYRHDNDFKVSDVKKSAKR